ncbi:MAG: GNAT family N-acetyltransferase [Candidatus Thorarchaeota archaeon]|jgi:GNAT superfamily N-acetyltransferase
MLEFSVENGLEAKEELLPLIEANWKEMTFDERVAIDLDWDVYEILVGANQLLFVSAREEGELVGYAIYTIMPKLLHHRGLSAAESDVFFLHPEHRKGSAAIKMIKYAEDVLQQIGVDIVFNSVKLAERDIGKILERMGHTPLEREYYKWLS